MQQLCGVHFSKVRSYDFDNSDVRKTYLLDVNLTNQRMKCYCRLNLAYICKCL
jgi:hypothetical protein